MTIQHTVEVGDVQRLIDRGLRVFPVDHPAAEHCAGMPTPQHTPSTCNQRGKHPCVPFTKEASNDTKAILHHFIGQYRNIGVATGDGLVVIDEDQPDGLRNYAAERGQVIPATYTVATGRGRHYYFQSAEEFGNGTGDLGGHGIDVRGHNGYVVGAGSVHHTGTVYAVEDDSPIAPMPEWVAEAIRTKPASESTDRRGLGIVDDVIRKGDRHQQLVKYAASLRARSIPLDEAVILFRPVWERCEQPPRCDTPVTWDEALGKLRDVYARYDEGRSAQYEPIRLDQRIQEAAEKVNAEASSDILSQIRDGNWLDAQVFPPLQWAVDGLISEGFGLLTGPPKLGKSWLLLGVLLAIAGRGRALGRIHVEQKPVLYLALEDGDRRMQSRVRALIGNDPTPAGFHFLTAAEPETIRDLISAWLDRYPEGVVGLDTLGKVMPPAKPGEGAYSRDYRVGGSLKRITDEHPGSTLIVVHHVRKQGSGDWMDSTSGTNGLNGSADWTLNLERVRGDGEAIIRVTGRDVIEGEYAATLRGGSWVLSGTNLDESAQIAKMTTKQDGLGSDSAAIIEFIADHPEGVKTAEVGEHMDWTDKKAANYLSRLVESGRIERPHRGLYTPVGSVGSVGFEGSGGDQESTPPTLGLNQCGEKQAPDQAEQSNPTLPTLPTLTLEQRREVQAS